MMGKKLGTAENGVPVTQEMVDEWNDAYDGGKIPAGYDDAEPVVHGRPPLFGEDMDTITVRIPAAQKEALKDEAADRGVSVSTYIRDILASRKTAAG